MRIQRQVSVGIAALALLLVVPGVASAAAPPNDNRANARVVRVPADVGGTTVDATRENGEPSSACANDGGSVWYRIRPGGGTGRVILTLAANGNLDAVVDVYRVRRSQLDDVTCDTTDEQGRSSFDFPVDSGHAFLIRVSRLANSASDSFRLTLRPQRPPATPPGRQLPRGGATGTLDRVFNPSDAYSVGLREGRTYRFNLATGHACTPLLLYPPGTTSFDGDTPVKTLGCGGYTQFTPDIGEGGRYSLLAEASGRRGGVPYRLMAARAGRDDTAPGRFIHNHTRVGGKLNANRIDVLDLYRFDVTKRSRLTLVLATSRTFDVRLITAGGHRIDRSFDELDATLRPGRYFAVVRAHRGESGSYHLTRVSRTLTRTHVSVDGRHRTTVRPGATVRLAAHVLPGVGGPVVLRIERYDPVFGWQFFRARRTRADRRTGRTAVGFRPPTVGRYRVQAFYLGTRASSPSESGIATWRVQRPLQE